MKGYAILGWGSLIWDLDNLAPHVRGEWEMAAGPMLPMEFTRISPKRKLGLVVCLDTQFGQPCVTHAIASVRDGIHDVVSDLSVREITNRMHIGAVCLASGHASGSSSEIVANVRRWCMAEGWSGAVWTDLPSNFTEHLGEAFTVPRAIAYLRGLTGDSLDEAVRYIEQAPAATNTPLRRAMATEAWWTAEAQRLRLR